jgi:acyl-CoA reductase-like NAD-dependent aldehyde dehydrogenase
MAELRRDHRRDHPLMYVDGAWVEARDGATFDTYDPATGEVIASVPRATGADVAVAVAAARRTFDDGTWGSAIAERERARIYINLGG